MKIIALSLIFIATHVLGEVPAITLTPNKTEGDTDYSKQLIKKFNALLESNKELKKQFSVFESPSQERAGGRYLGHTATPLLLHHSEGVDFGGDGGERNYKQTIVLYYSFGEGYRGGMEVTSGVFAIFQLTGKQLYDPEGDDFKLTKHTVTAKFKGFKKTLHAEKGEEK